mgnify:CR=1 FL=1
MKTRNTIHVTSGKVFIVEHFVKENTWWVYDTNGLLVSWFEVDDVVDFSDYDMTPRSSVRVWHFTAEGQFMSKFCVTHVGDIVIIVGITPTVSFRQFEGSSLQWIKVPTFVPLHVVAKRKVNQHTDIITILIPDVSSVGPRIVECEA